MELNARWHLSKIDSSFGGSIKEAGGNDLNLQEIIYLRLDLDFGRSVLEEIGDLWWYAYLSLVTLREIEKKLMLNRKHLQLENLLRNGHSCKYGDGCSTRQDGFKSYAREGQDV